MKKITKYVVGSEYKGATIDIVKCDKETAQCVWVNGSRRNKSGGYERYFDSWDDAHSFLQERTARTVVNLKDDLATAQAMLKAVGQLRK